MKKLIVLENVVVSLFLSGCSIFTDNFHRVHNGVYRSGQLDAKTLEEKIKMHNIRSVINLRGEASEKTWYKSEKETCKIHDVDLYDISLSASTVHKEQIEELLDVFERAEYPLLIHCRAGADRAGFASALFRIHMLKHNVKDADDELSLCYGHIAIPAIGNYELDEFLLLYDKSGVKGLREFIKVEYAKKP